MAKVVSVACHPNGYILMVDSDGNVWWRPWERNGWKKFKDLPVFEENNPTSAPIPPMAVHYEARDPA